MTSDLGIAAGFNAGLIKVTGDDFTVLLLGSVLIVEVDNVGTDF
jgi:hypothetical protein